jgi:hypothetical protein
VRDHALGVQLPHLVGLDLLDLLGRRQVAAVRVAAVEPLQQRLPRDDAGLAAVDGQLLHEPVALAQHLALGVRRRRQDLAEQREERRQAGHEHRAAEREPVAVGAGRQGRPEALQVGGDLRGVAVRGAEQHRLAEQRRAGGVRRLPLAGRAGERDAQPHLGQRDAGAPDGQHPQAVVEDDVLDRRQPERPLRGQRRDWTGQRAGHAAPPGRSSSTARLSGRREAAASCTAPGPTARSSSGSSSTSSARPRCCSKTDSVVARPRTGSSSR